MGQLHVTLAAFCLLIGIAYAAAEARTSLLQPEVELEKMPDRFAECASTEMVQQRYHKLLGQNHPLQDNLDSRFVRSYRKQLDADFHVAMEILQDDETNHRREKAVRKGYYCLISGAVVNIVGWAFSMVASTGCANHTMTTAMQNTYSTVSLVLFIFGSFLMVAGVYYFCKGFYCIECNR